jgi:hypothetical protein
MRFRQKVVCAGIAAFLALPLYAQGLFESASSDSTAGATEADQSKALVVGGFIKGAFFGGHDNDHEEAVTGAYGQTSLKLDYKKSGIARAFAEARLTAGFNRELPFADVEVREAWGAVSPGFLDIKAGRQIIAWGRADGINPTNNITPRDQTILSSEYDDTRLGNELLLAKIARKGFGITGIWIPYFRPDVLPLDGAELPAGITIAEPVYPDHRIKNGGYALRLDCFLSSFDGSLSYFNGFATLPGFDYSLGLTGLSLIPRAYRMQAIGADFSTTVASLGLRGEAAVKIPDDDAKSNVFVPNTWVHYVFGLDKTIGNWSVLAQYSGVYVNDFQDIVKPQLMNLFDPRAQMQYAALSAAAEIRRLNRLFTGTSREVSHSVTGQVQWNAMYETLHIKLAGMYNVTTEDYALSPDLTYDISDAVGISVGGRYLNGPEGEINDLVSDLMSFVYTELKMSF